MFLEANIGKRGDYVAATLARGGDCGRVRAALGFGVEG